MDKIAILGPANTFTDLAATQYMNKRNLNISRNYYTTITKVFNAIGKDCRYGIIPIENTIDGYVQVSLDLLAKGNLQIVYETILPIEFVFISKVKKLEDVKTLFLQFKTHNQCLNFIETLGDVDIITTASNGTSYMEYLENNNCDAVIIPRHILDSRANYGFINENVEDTEENETRFVILSKSSEREYTKSVKWRSSFVIKHEGDRPGLLSDILNVFSTLNINLKSIISRPNKKGLGKYNFFIDIEGCYENDIIVKKAIEIIKRDNNIKILGSYYVV